MALTQQAVLSLLITEGGKVKKSDLVGKFKSSVDCDDPAERDRNRELFKTFVNNVAFVKEIDGVRYVVVRKMYHHMLDSVQTVEKTGDKEIRQTGEQQRPPARSKDTEHGENDGDAAGGGRSAVSEPDPEETSNDSGENPTEILSPIQMALRRSKSMDVKVKRMMNFDIQRQEASGDGSSRSGSVNETSRVQSKPYALPLRVPPSTTRVEIHKLKVVSEDPPESPTIDPFRNKRRVETGCSVSSPLLRRSVKSTKASEEPKESRLPSLVPLEQSEHEWLVRCAAGHWSQVYGLLLRDNQLAEKRDFMSGFTALHWAAKCGNSEMLLKIIDLSKEGGVDLDVNAKAHGGYTPLHIAALHDQEYIMAMLVAEFGADPSIRDNCGKRAYHYLHKGISGTVREMLGEPKVQAQQAQERTAHEKEELDLFPDLSRGLHSISRLFQPHVTIHKKKHKQRPAFFSLSEEPSEEREDSGGSHRQRVVSEAFM